MNRIIIIYLILIYSATHMSAGHLLGGEMSFSCIENGKYTVKMILYRDCSSNNGITLFDSSVGAFYKATVTVYHGSSSMPFIDSIVLDPPSIAPVSSGSINFCTDVPKRCVEKATYEFEIDLPISDEPYTIVYQRCCRSQSTTNIIQPERNGITISTVINPLCQKVCGSGMEFRKPPARLLCVDEPWRVDHSAMNLGTSNDTYIRYELCALLKGGDRTSPDGLAPNPDAPPPYEKIDFVGGNYTEQSPFGSDPPISIDPVSGRISGIPQFTGHYSVGVCAIKYDKDGNVLARLRRDYNYQVVECLRKVDASVKSDTIEGNFQVIRFCGDEPIEIIDESEQEEFIKSYTWYFDIQGNEQQYIGKSPSFEFPDSGTIEGKLILNEGMRCPDTALIKVRIMGKISNSFSYEYDTCRAGPVLLEGNASSENGPILMNEWILDYLDTFHMRDIQLEFLEPGNKLILYRVKDSVGCVSEVEGQIPYFPIPNEIVIDPMSADRCSPARIFFNNLSYPLDSSYTIRWDFGDGGSSGSISPGHIYENAGRYLVHLMIESPIGCLYEGSLEDSLFILQSPEAGFSIFPNDPNQFTEQIFIEDHSRDAAAWNYRLEDFASSIEQDPVFTIPDTGNYSLEQIVTHSNGCKDTLLLKFEVGLKAVYHLPNAFTPDNDGVNDIYVGTGDFNSFSNFEMHIFNRWGERVFFSREPSRGWNGSRENNGLILPQAVYTVIVRYQDPSGKVIQEKTFATLIR